MMRKRVSYLLLLGATAVFAGCSKDVDGELVTPTVVAGLRYVNVVPDTGGMDIRIIDVVGDAPNTYNATFRTGGAPYGVAISGLPVHTAVLAGTRQIRAFMSSSNPAIASTVMLDTTFDFQANTNYTVYLYGYANPAGPGRPAGAPSLRALVAVDSQLTLAAGKIAVRVLNLAATVAGNPAGAAATTLDGRISRSDTAIAGTAQVTGLGVGAMSNYVVLDTTGVVTSSNSNPVRYRLAALATGTATPILMQATLPLGTRGSSSSNPVPGTGVAGTVMTAIIVPQSVTGTSAPQGVGPDTANTDIASVTRSNDTVTITRAILAGNGTTTCDRAVVAGAAFNDIIHVAGLNEAGYNGAHSVVSTTAGASLTRFTTRTLTLTGAASGETFTITVGGATTTPIAMDATAATVETTLGALLGARNVTVSGAAGGPYTIRFMGTYAGNLVTGISAASTAGTATMTTNPVTCSTPVRVSQTVTLTGAVAGDQFRITAFGSTTANIAFDAPTDTVRARLGALSSIGGTANVAVTGTPGTSYTISFRGGFDNQNVEPISAAMVAGSTGTIAASKAAPTFGGAASASRVRYRIAATAVPASPATGTPTFRIANSGADYTSPFVLINIDQLPTRTAP